jgi:hypothetical protein
MSSAGEWELNLKHVLQIDFPFGPSQAISSDLHPPSNRYVGLLRTLVGDPRVRTSQGCRGKFLRFVETS